MGLLSVLGTGIGAAFGGPLGAAIGGTVGGLLDGDPNKEANKANANVARANQIKASAERRINKIRQRIQERQDRSSRLQALRGNRSQRADITSSAESGGVSQGSGVKGAKDSSSSSFARELKASLELSADTREISDVNNKASEQAQTFIGLASENRQNQLKDDASNDLFNSAVDIFGKINFGKPT